MATKKVWVGKVGPFIYDDVSGDVYIEDGIEVSGLRMTGQGRLEQDPTLPLHFMNLRYLQNNTLNYYRSFIEVVDINDPSPELLTRKGTANGGVIFCYQVKDTVNEFAGYYWDSSSTDPASSPYRIQGDGGFWLGWFRNVEGETHQEGNHFPAIDDEYQIGGDVDDGIGAENLGWIARFSECRVRKTPTADNDVVRKIDIDGLGAGSTEIQYVSVADITNPATELLSIDNTNGSILIARQIGASSNDTTTIYVWDSSAGTTSSPQVVQGSGGKWIAIGGRYCNSSLTVVGNLVCSAVLSGLSLSVTNAVTAGSITASGASAINATLAVTGNTTFGGIQTQTTQPCMDATFSGALSIANATDVSIVWSSETFDQDNNFASSIFTAPATGKYLITGGAAGTCAAATPAGFLVTYQVFKNGSLFFSFTSPSGAAFGVNGSRVASLASTDAITIKMRQNTGDTASCTSAYLSIIKIA